MSFKNGEFKDGKKIDGEDGIEKDKEQKRRGSKSVKNVSNETFGHRRHSSNMDIGLKKKSSKDEDKERKMRHTVKTVK